MTEINKLFIRACRALYGDLWQSSAGRALDISDRHIRRIVSGDASARPGMLTEMLPKLDERRQEIESLVQELKDVRPE